MTANELADWLDKKAIVSFTEYFGEHLELAADLLRQQQAEIEALKEIIKRLTIDWTDDFKNYKYNSDVPEQNKMRDDVFAILKKESEK